MKFLRILDDSLLWMLFPFHVSEARIHILKACVPEVLLPYLLGIGEMEVEVDRVCVLPWAALPARPLTLCLGI